MAKFRGGDWPMDLEDLAMKKERRKTVVKHKAFQELPFRAA